MGDDMTEAAVPSGNSGFNALTAVPCKGALASNRLVRSRGSEKMQSDETRRQLSSLMMC
jgi:hypothetical protein